MKWKLIPLLLVLAVPLPAQQVLNLRDADIRAFIQDVGIEPTIPFGLFLQRNMAEGMLATVGPKRPSAFRVL